MAEMITDKTMDEIEILAKLHLTEDEKEKSRQDLQQMLDYVDMLNQLDTSDVEPLTHIFPIKNVFREDVVLESTPKEELLKNAPKEKDARSPQRKPQRRPWRRSRRKIRRSARTSPWMRRRSWNGQRKWTMESVPENTQARWQVSRSQ